MLWRPLARRRWPACAVLVWLAAMAVTGAATEAIPARNTATLRQKIGEQVTVYGRVERTGKSRSGFQFLNFANSDFTVVCHPEDVANFPDGAPADRYPQQDVEVRGVLELFKDKPQIRLRKPAQIRVRAGPPVDPPKRIKLKQVGPETWLSPAGLRYHGRDPQGLTRVEHVRRHVTDQPSRAGPHGVFDGGPAVAFAVIDEAWQQARQQQLRPQREGRRSSFTVHMGRRIGYLGGRLGRQRGNPPLKRVFIVFESGTKNIVTAFPK